MTRLIVAFGFLTRLPMPRVAVEADDFAAAIRFYPLVGLAIGVLVALAGWLGAHVDPWTGACAALLAWIAVTGALHLDGLADLADGLGAAHGDRTRLLAVMADPHIGSFGVVAIAGQMIAKLVLLHAAGPAGWWALILIPFAARMGPLVWARLLPPLRSGGLGAAVAGAVRNRDLWAWALMLALAAVAVPALVVLPVLVLGVAAWLRRTLGGVTGDAHGAGIEIVETGLLAAIAVAGALA
ncbi:adenosylcobinamide-GDP ribazoletransferase [Sphingomonas aurantiaca]|uniref:Adenosylcobinamide-GDP ribazoletransferase n=1 Tax=Sphingomonas aurantiaca TaxID=185949 RepID=A0A2T5GHY2_9SPHN|nr:adenosylcobinamide-GDP ribazoletransferase [Sphingomonas aurantiaca]PTQ58928.1 cobalamin-5'-phosphate synthase [Sphingomonas aurantiaca]